MAAKRQRFDGKFHEALLLWLREQSLIQNRSVNNIVETILMKESEIQLPEGTYNRSRTPRLPADNQA